MENDTMTTEAVQATTSADSVSTDAGLAPAVAENATTQAPATAGSFLDLLSDDLRGEPSLQDFKDIEGLAKSYVNQAHLVGNSIRIPAKDASPEAWADFRAKFEQIPGAAFVDGEDRSALYAKLGKPSDASEYQVSLPEGMADDGLMDTFKKTAFEANLTQEQVQALSDFRAMEIQKYQEQVESTVNTFKAQQKEVFGQELQNRLNIGNQALTKYMQDFPEAGNALAQDRALLNNPAFIAMMADLGKTLHENGGLENAGSAQSFGMSPMEASRKIDQLKSDRGFMDAYYSKLNPGHREAVRRMEELHQLAFPEMEE